MRQYEQYIGLILLLLGGIAMPWLVYYICNEVALYTVGVK